MTELCSTPATSQAEATHLRSDNFAKMRELRSSKADVTEIRSELTTSKGPPTKSKSFQISFRAIKPHSGSLV